MLRDGNDISAPIHNSDIIVTDNSRMHYVFSACTHSVCFVLRLKAAAVIDAFSLYL